MGGRGLGKQRSRLRVGGCSLDEATGEASTRVGRGWGARGDDEFCVVDSDLTCGFAARLSCQVTLRLQLCACSSKRRLQPLDFQIQFHAPGHLLLSCGPDT